MQFYSISFLDLASRRRKLKNTVSFLQVARAVVPLFPTFGLLVYAQGPAERPLFPVFYRFSTSCLPVFYWSYAGFILVSRAVFQVVYVRFATTLLSPSFAVFYRFSTP